MKTAAGSPDASLFTTVRTACNFLERRLATTTEFLGIRNAAIMYPRNTGLCIYLRVPRRQDASFQESPDSNHRSLRGAASDKHLLASLPPEDFQRVSSQLTWRPLKVRQTLHKHGEPISRRFFFRADRCVRSPTPWRTAASSKWRPSAVKGWWALARCSAIRSRRAKPSSRWPASPQA